MGTHLGFQKSSIGSSLKVVGVLLGVSSFDHSVLGMLGLEGLLEPLLESLLEELLFLSLFFGEVSVGFVDLLDFLFDPGDVLDGALSGL